MLNHKTRTVAFLLLLICATLLCGCGALQNPSAVTAAPDAAQPAPTDTPAPDAALPAVAFSINEPSGAADEIVVSTVDELLSALGSDRTLYLLAGEYALTEAADYGAASASDCYEWVEEYDGFGLCIRDVENLRIVGHSASDVSISTLPRYANVLSFQDCAGILIDGVTAGHAEGPGMCAGAVLRFASTDGASVKNCDLYGCGTRGVETERCADVAVEDCVIRDCTLGAVDVTDSRSVRIERCRVTGCGDAEDPALSLVTAAQSSGVAILDCTAENNVCTYLLDGRYCRDVQLLSSAFSKNTVTQAAFALTQCSPVVEGCAFSDNRVAAWYAEGAEFDLSAQAVSKSGQALTGEDLDGMRRSEVAFEPAKTAAPVQPEASVVNGMREVRVSNVDELLASIASDTTVFLSDGLYVLSEASDYGMAGTRAYRWLDQFDGPGLVITGVSNFHIVGGGAGGVAIHAVPRYADVLAFEDCENVSVSGVTAGHAEAPGECTGGVLRFDRVSGAAVRDCALFGCGILGVSAAVSRDVAIDNTEIYDCSSGAVALYDCDGVALTNCFIHDCGEPTFLCRGCRNVTRDGKEIE